MNILAISDLHGYLPDISQCDLLLLGGDYCPTRNLEQEYRFMLGPFSEWLKKVPARHIVGVAGNHDFVLEREPSLARGLPWTYLQDESIEIEGIKIHGSPWVPEFGNWAFMKHDSHLRDIFAKIPSGLDILLTHGPAYRHLDKTIGGVNAGSFQLWDRIKQTEPNSHVFGHIHEERGILQEDDIRYFNVAHCNARMEPRHEPVHIPLRVA